MAARLTTALVLLAAAGVAAQSNAATESDLADHVIEPDAFCRIPRERPSVAAELFELFRMTELPLGFEALPQPVPDRRAPSADYVDCAGMTVGQILDLVVALAGGQYGWLETRGVLVVRPLMAWNDKAHYLDEVRGNFTVDDNNVEQAVELIHRFLDPDRPHGPLTQGTSDTRLTFTVPGASVLDALNAVVTAYEPGFWSMRYSWPPCADTHHAFTFRAKPPCSAASRDVWLDATVNWLDGTQIWGRGWFQWAPEQVVRPETPMHSPFWPLR